MKTLSFALLLAAAPVLAGDLRLFNPTDDAAVATIACGGVSSARTVAPHELIDVVGDDCSASGPLVFRIETRNGVEWQQLQAAPADACAATAPLMLPLTGCRFGSAVAAVAAVDGATYSWSVDGGSILSGAGTERILIAIEGGNTLRVTVAIAKDGCTTAAAGVMALHDAFTIKTLDPGSGAVGQPRTIAWSFASGEPSTQILSGTDFPSPVSLPPGARSYTFTPSTGGDREVILDASLATALPGRSRAAGRGTGSASSCGVARAKASYHIDCIRPAVDINVPGSVGTGKAFIARVALPPGSTAAWTIANATPASAVGESVTITPSGTMAVDISVTVTTNGGCAASATAHVVVNQACDNPTATLSVLRNDCAAAVLQARFTGTPPFRGAWENGQPFLTSDSLLDRPVSASGTYSISQFQDATCVGSSGGSASITVKTSAVALTAPNGLCAGGSAKAVATFSGAPPFTGTWSDGVTFATSSTTLQRSVTTGGPLSLTFSDANCGPKTSAALPFIQPGTASLAFNSQPPTCLLGNLVRPFDLAVTVTGGAPPYKVTWFDGFVQTASASPILRTVYPNAYGAAAITRVQDLTCDLAISNGAVSVPLVPGVYIELSTYSSYLCPGVQYSAYDWGSVPPGATLNWRVTNGTIVSGQGTTTLVFKAGTTGSNMTVSCDLTFAGCTNTGDVTRPVHGPTPANVGINPGAVAVGQKATITILLASDTQSYTVTSSSPTDHPVFVYGQGWSYTPTVKGDVTITVRVTGTCGITADTAVPLSVF